MESNFQVFVKEKVLEHLNELKVFAKDMEDLSINRSKEIEVVKVLKKKDPTLKAEDVKEQLHAIMLNSSEVAWRSMQIANKTLLLFNEYKLLADIHKIDLDLSKDDMEFLSRITDAPATLFVVEGGKVKPRDPEMHKRLVEETSKNALLPENLEGCFKSIKD